MNGKITTLVPGIQTRRVSRLLLLHGWNKLTSFSETVGKFPDPLSTNSNESIR
jgi:hypothetical protein